MVLAAGRTNSRGCNVSNDYEFNLPKESIDHRKRAVGVARRVADTYDCSMLVFDGHAVAAREDGNRGQDC